MKRKNALVIQMMLNVFLLTNYEKTKLHLSFDDKLSNKAFISLRYVRLMKFSFLNNILKEKGNNAA